MNLSFGEYEGEDINNGVFPGRPGSNNQQRAHSVDGTRFDEHGDDDLAQSTNSSYPQGSASVLCMQDEPDNDHEGEEDVECDRN